MDEDTRHLIKRIGQLLDRVDPLLPFPATAPDWHNNAFRWCSNEGLKAIANPHLQRLDDLLFMDDQKTRLVRNTQQFVAGHPANHALLWGSRGTGKSSLIKAVFNRFLDQGLKLIELDRQDLSALPDVIQAVGERPEPFILYCDDLSFEPGDPSYKSLKAILEGSIASPPRNLLVYATSNRRHLLPEFRSENLNTSMLDGEIHHSESVEEKVSLSDRFGLWLSFYPFNQEQYLSIVSHWLQRLCPNDRNRREEVTQAALQWALTRGARSGRVAWQFARDWTGRHSIDKG